MTTRKKPASTDAAAKPKSPGDDVDALLADLAHPQHDVIVRLRDLIKAADPRITESWKWNAPSFALADHFCTFQLRKGVMLVLHFGPKKRTPPLTRPTIADPTHLLTWLAEDRATLTFTNLAEVTNKQQALQNLLRSWIAALT